MFVNVFVQLKVILTPLPMRENSTYINASFIEGYDNSETFIIAQDPLENTIGDFWRMISEQSVTTLVMISEVSSALSTLFVSHSTECFNCIADRRWSQEMPAILGRWWGSIRSHTREIRAQRKLSILYSPRILCYELQNRRYAESHTISIQWLAHRGRRSSWSLPWHYRTCRSSIQPL